MRDRERRWLRRVRGGGGGGGGPLQVVKQAVESAGLMPAYCDSVQNGGAMWKAGMGRLAFLFYLSKYYEFVDTIILVVKRKRVLLLQTYHHAGAVRVQRWSCETHTDAEQNTRMVPSGDFPTYKTAREVERALPDARPGAKRRRRC
jgi:hypothetical protein